MNKETVIWTSTSAKLQREETKNLKGNKTEGSDC